MKIASNVEWQKWGKDDPFYGVSSCQDREKAGAFPWTVEDFYEYGRRVWAEVSPHWDRYGCVRNTCVEVGCGAGRLTKQLATEFQKVYAVDVSLEMLDLARRYVTAPHVEFCLTDGSMLPLPDGSVTAAFSTDVFQHFDAPILADRYFRELYRVLQPRGTFMLQIPIYLWPMPRQGLFTYAFRTVYGAARLHDRLRASLKRWAIALGYGQAFLHGIRYDGRWVMRKLAEIGFTDVEIQFFAHSGQGWQPSPAVCSYFFGMKNPGSSMGKLRVL